MPKTSLGFQYPWKQVNIGSVGDVDVGGTPSTAIPSFWGGNVPWMSSGEVHQRRIYDVQGRITELGLRSSNAKLIDPPAVAIALAGQGKTRGTAALTLARLCTNQSVALIKGRSGTLDTVFLFHILDFRYEELRMRSSGGGRGGLSKAIIEAIPIALPEVDEQQKIAQILDTIDNLITLTDRHIAKLKLAKAGLLHDLLTRGIDENGDMRDPIGHPEHFKETGTWISSIPKDWHIETLGNLAVNGISNGYFKKPELVGSGYRLINVLDLYQEIGIDLNLVERVNASKKEYIQYFVQEGDCFFTRSSLTLSGIAHCNIIRHLPESALFECHLMRVRPDQSKIVPEFLAQFCRSDIARRFLMRHAKQVTMTTISQPDIASLLIPIPSKEEQICILKYLNKQTLKIHSKELRLEKLRLLKKGLMTDLLTGRVRVNLDVIKEG